HVQRVAHMYNALRNSVVRPGDVVAIVGVGGLGHLGVQYTARLGFNTVAVVRGREKEELACELGARHYVDSTAQHVARARAGLGGAGGVPATAPASAAMSAAVNGLAPRGSSSSRAPPRSRCRSHRSNPLSPHSRGERVQAELGMAPRSGEAPDVHKYRY